MESPGSSEVPCWSVPHTSRSDEGYRDREDSLRPISHFFHSQSDSEYAIESKMYNIACLFHLLTSLARSSTIRTSIVHGSFSDSQHGNIHLLRIRATPSSLEVPAQCDTLEETAQDLAARASQSLESQIMQEVCRR